MCPGSIEGRYSKAKEEVSVNPVGIIGLYILMSYARQHCFVFFGHY